MPLYYLLLLIYPYWLRSNYFHGSKTLPVFLAYNDPEMQAFLIVNYFIDKYLDEHIPMMITESGLDDNVIQRIKDFLCLRDKGKCILSVCL